MTAFSAQEQGAHLGDGVAGVRGSCAASSESLELFKGMVTQHTASGQGSVLGATKNVLLVSAFLLGANSAWLASSSLGVEAWAWGMQHMRAN